MQVTVAQVIDYLNQLESTQQVSLLWTEKTADNICLDVMMEALEGGS